MSRRGRLLPALVLLLGLVEPASAQVPRYDPLDWSSLQPGPVWSVTGDVLDDGSTAWQAVRLGFAAALPRGEGRWLWLRWRYVSFSTAGAAVSRRWPAAVDSVSAAAGWPGETTVTGWDRPELGMIGRSRLPVLGGGRYALRGALPFADNRLYPLADRGTSLALAWRKEWSGGQGRVRAALTGERVLNFGAAGDDLTDDAFPSLTLLSGEITLSPGRGSVLSVEGTAVHHRGGSLGLAVGRDLGTAWRLDAGWRHDFGNDADRTFRNVFHLRLLAVGGGTAAPEEDREVAEGQGRRGALR